MAFAMARGQHKTGCRTRRERGCEVRMHERAAVAYGDAREGKRSEGVREAIMSFARMRVSTRRKRGDRRCRRRTENQTLPGCRRAQSRRYGHCAQHARRGSESGQRARDCAGDGRPLVPGHSRHQRQSEARRPRHRGVSRVVRGSGAAGPGRCAVRPRKRPRARPLPIARTRLRARRRPHVARAAGIERAESPAEHPIPDTGPATRRAAQKRRACRTRQE